MSPLPPPTPTRAETQLRGKRIDIGGAFSLEGDQPGVVHIHESAPAANDAQLILDGAATIKGNLTVLGSTTSVQSVTMDITDVNITLNKGGNDATADGSGITVERVTAPFPSLVWKEGLQAWAVGKVGSEKEITHEGNIFNGAGKLTKLDGSAKIPIAASQTFIHEQVAPLASWAINHGMNKRPSVTVVTSAGDEVIGSVNYADDNNLTVTCAGAYSGKAYLN